MVLCDVRARLRAGALLRAQIGSRPRSDSRRACPDISSIELGDTKTADGSARLSTHSEAGCPGSGLEVGTVVGAGGVSDPSPPASHRGRGISSVVGRTAVLNRPDRWHRLVPVSLQRKDNRASTVGYSPTPTTGSSRTRRGALRAQIQPMRRSQLLPMSQSPLCPTSR